MIRKSVRWKMHLLAMIAMGAMTHSPASAKDKVKIAFFGPLTGANSNIGIGGRNSADLAIRLRNASSKYEYELAPFDDECKPNVGLQVVTRAATDTSISAAIAHYCSSVALATVSVFHKFGLPMLVWSAVAPEITDAQQFIEINRIGPSALDQQKIGPKFLHDMGYKTWAVVHDTTAYGTSLDKYFKGFLDEAGGEIVGNFGVTPDQQDFAVEVTKIASLKPQVVYIEALAPIAVRLKLQMDKQGFLPQIDSVSGVFADEYIKNLGAAAEGTLSRRNGAPIEELPGGKEFLSEYDSQKYGHPPDVWGHFAFAEANMLIDIIEKVGPDRDKIKKALRDVKDFPTMLGPVTFNDNGQNIHSTASVVVVQDGKWVSWDQSEYASGKRKLKALP